MSHPVLKKQIFAVPHPKHKLISTGQEESFPFIALSMKGHEFDNEIFKKKKKKNKFRSLNISYFI